MKIIYKVDKIFILIYSAIIIGIGLLTAVYLNNFSFMLIPLMVESLYLYFSLKKTLKRYRNLKKEFPVSSKEFIFEHSPFYRGLDQREKEKFENNIKIFLGEFPIRGIRGEEIDMETKLLVALGFATLLHGRPDWEPPLRDGILVYPGKTFNKDYQIDRGEYAGMARVNSPLIVTEESLWQSFLNKDDSFNVIYHELAHYFDFEDGEAQGIPARNIFYKDFNRWRQIIQDEWIKAQSGASFLGDYAGTSPAELFAVATELFFENPRLMIEQNKDLYQILLEFYNVDTADVLSREEAGGIRQ